MAKHKSIPVEERKRITRSIYEASDLSEAVLKGHLYVEFVLNELFLLKWPHSLTIVDRFSFDQKVIIAEGTKLIEDEWALGSMRALNRIRNLYAHSLLPDGVETQVASIPLIDPAVEHTLLEPLPKIKAISLTLCSFMTGIMDRFNKIDSPFPPDWLVLGAWDKVPPNSGK